jgi:hypothetical protein
MAFELVNSSTFVPFSLRHVSSQTFSDGPGSVIFAIREPVFLPVPTSIIISTLVENIPAGFASPPREKVRVRQMVTCEIEDRINNKHTHSKSHRSIGAMP